MSTRTTHCRPRLSPAAIGSAVAGALLLMQGMPAHAEAASGAATAQAQPAAQVSATRVGVVNLSRLMDESPQAQQAKSNMAKRFKQRKDVLEKTASALEAKAQTLKDQGESMDEARRDALSADIRDQQRELSLKQSQYNDDVSDAEKQELKRLRKDLRAVISAYAQDHGYDVILSDDVLYARPSVDVTDQILARLKQSA